MFKKLGKKIEREFNRIVEPNLHEKLKNTHQFIEGRQATVEASLTSLQAIIKDLQSEIPALEQSYQVANDSAHSPEETLTLQNAENLLQILKSFIASLIADREIIQLHQKTINEKSQAIKEIRNNGTPDKNITASEETKGHNLANEANQIYQQNIEPIIQAYQGKIGKITEARNDFKSTLVVFDKLKLITKQKQVLENLRAVLETPTNGQEAIDSKIKRFNEAFNALEENHVNIDIPLADSQTLMHIAAQQPYHVEIFSKLLKKNPDLSREDNLGWTPVHYAAKSSHSMGWIALVHFANHPQLKAHPEWFTKASARYNNALLSPLEVARAFNQKEAEKQILAVISLSSQVKNPEASQINVCSTLVDQASALIASLSTHNNSVSATKDQATLLPQFKDNPHATVSSTGSTEEDIAVLHQSNKPSRS